MTPWYSIRLGLFVACAALLTNSLFGAPPKPGVQDSPASTIRGIGLLPASITFYGPDDRRRLVVQALAATDGEASYLGQIEEGVKFESSNQKVVRISGGVAIPTGNGRATITARAGSHTAVAEVRVSGFDESRGVSFRNHVISVLSKAGCNGGACHGAVAGKNGFRLSLFGYNPQADHAYITGHARGRRINLADPARSLLLTKPTGAIPHKGGLRLEVGSRSYQVLADWIAEGAPPPRSDDPTLERLEILPSQSRQSLGATQQFLVLAHFTDGRVEDVTHWARYRSNNESVAKIDPAGRATIVGSGEAAVNAWYLNQNVQAYLTVPFPNEAPLAVYREAARNNFIDRLILAKLESLNLPPSPPADDATFLRRAFLDTIGVLPTVEEAKRFLADSDPNKRSKLIDQLLARPEFVDYWSYKWSDLLLVNSKELRPAAVKAYYGWIRAQVAANTPWDELARRIVAARGSTLENGAANFYALHELPTDMAETVSQTFLGMSINCAKCHNHPLEKWTNDQYYGFANLFARVRAKGHGGDVRKGDGNRIVFDAPRGELVQPSKGVAQPPRVLDGPPLPTDATVNRREELARWLTAPENPYFTRAIVNRVWANFMGVGLIEPIDDVRLTNPASNRALLSALCDHLVQEKYDLKELMRTILNSAAYQRSSRALPGNRQDRRYYARFYPRRLKAEVLLDAVSQVSGTPTQFKGQPAGARALQLPDVNVDSYFLDTFGRPERLITCECERSNEPSMTQVLHLINGDTILSKLASKESRLTAVATGNKSWEAVLDKLYLAALSRRPTPAERARMLREIESAAGAGRRQLLEDLYWSVLTSREFMFNH